ncbi:putative cell cycle checkpoint protein rad17 [Diaporthe ampelina]|uniref:Putative cell cycle checkpoint protein rad17 n=1 Tax=Diaporthe ampelina TaxID=1214573 RepID=A0A0G2FS85_9PEZI|nr:putative cell cycle checkpoint protein rad17 [Diaporthe ampelina]
MAPPAKRRRRNLVADEEDDEGEGPQPTSTTTPKKNSLNFYFSSPAKPSNADGDEPRPQSPSPIRKSTRSTRAAVTTLPAQGNGSRSRPSSAAPLKSYGKSPAKGKKQLEEKGKSANIQTLFSKQSQRALTEGRPNGVATKAETQPLDILSDPLSDDEEIGAHRAAGSSLVGKKAHKRTGDAFDSATSSNISGAASQRFMKPPRLNSAPSSNGEDKRPWSERFGPLSLDELVVHKKKVADVRKWLDDVLSGRMRQRLLVLKGSAGTGKTTTIQLLAKELGFEILEWRNPTGSAGTTQGYQSASAQFEEFMGRGGKFGQLDLDDDNSAPSTVQGSQEVDQKRVILIEEFPNTFMRSGSALTSFRRTVLQCLANSTPLLAAFGQHGPSEPMIPMVMIISETLLTTTSATADSFTAHRLLGPEILRHPGTGVIEYNDVAPTLLVKALELVVKKEARISGRRRTPGPLVLKRLAEIGDVRSAISSLEFLCLKGDGDADWGSKVAFTKTKKASKDQVLTKGEQESLELISQREASLGIFHAVGKVVYNKRDEQSYPAGSEEALAEQMPPHLEQLSRPKRSQVAVGALIDEMGTDTSTFISALHENYALSCERTGPSDPNSSIDYVNDCIEYLSESDLLNPSWDIFFGGKGFSNMGKDQGSHILRQDEMAFEVAVRGLLFSLPCPVKRKSATSGRGSDTFKMYYPTSIKLWKVKEEMEGLVDLWATKMLKGEGEKPASTPVQTGHSGFSSGASAFRRTKGDSVGDWVSNRSEMKYAARSIPAKAEREEVREAETSGLLSLGNSARKEMVLERLPYMAHMTRSRRTSFCSMGVRDLDKMVSFQGIGPPADAESDAEVDEGAAPAGEAWATDKPTEDASPRKRRAPAIRSRDDEGEGSMISSLQNKLVLSDDDIEDD